MRCCLIVFEDNLGPGDEASRNNGHIWKKLFNWSFSLIKKVVSLQTEKHGVRIWFCQLENLQIKLIGWVRIRWRQQWTRISVVLMWTSYLVIYLICTWRQVIIFPSCITVWSIWDQISSWWDIDIITLITIYVWCIRYII